MGLLKKISNKILLIINIVIVVLFLLACVAPYIHPEKGIFLYVLSLVFPFLLFSVIIFLSLWLFVKRKWALISMVALLMGGGAITDFFAFNIYNKYKETKEKNSIRIATWNVARFIERMKNNNVGSQTRYKMLRQIKKTNADILCLQEFSSSINPDWYNNIIAILKGLKYPYCYYSHDWDGSQAFNGSIIFSRFPIKDTGIVRYPRPTLPDALIFADIKKDKDVFRVYTTHLQSNQFQKEDISRIEELKEGKGNVFNNGQPILQKLKKAIKYRAIQANLIKEVLKNSPYPTIFCGDLNDVPNSYTYKAIKGNMQDAHLQKGFGIGRTFSSLSPTLRIDYIFADANFTFNQIGRVTTNYSDHYMVIADLILHNIKN